MPPPGAPPLGYGADLEGVQRVASCRSHKQGSDDRSLQERHRGPTRSPRSDEWPLFAHSGRPVSTLSGHSGSRPRTAQLGGKRAYTSKFGKDRSASQSCRSVASTKLASPPFDDIAIST